MLVKICGIRRKLDIEYVNELMPDFIGFVFTKSKRQITLNEALELKRNLNHHIKAVGVFRNDDIEFVLSIAKSGVIDIIQLHGDESDDYIKIIKEETNLKIINAYRDSEYADYSLFDNQDPGHGVSFDWETIKTNKPYFLAGGINLENLSDAIKLNPYCIDTSSSVETDGFKDYFKMKEFIRRCRDYERD